MPTRYKICLLVLALFASACSMRCRVPQWRLPENPAIAEIYDPKTDDALARAFPRAPEVQARYDRYRTALAEPVSVVAWEDSHALVQIFYATNRTPRPSADGLATYHSDWSRQLSLGACRVRLPKDVRGSDRTTQPRGAHKKWFSFASSQNANDEGPEKETHVLVGPSLPLDEEHFRHALRETVARSPERDVFVFVHGFNVTYEACVTRAAQLAVDLPFNGAVVAYSWPTQGGVSNYGGDETIVAESAAPFVQFLETVDAAVPPETNIHILVHSMGNRLVLNGLAQLPDRFRQPPRFANVILTAPDVAVDDFAKLAGAAQSVARRTTLYVSDGDTALMASKARHGVQRIGDAFPPVVHAGIETVDVSALDSSFMGHSYYGGNRRALSDLFALIKEDRGAAERGWLKRQSNEQGEWWTFAMLPSEVRWVWHFEHLQR